MAKYPKYFIVIEDDYGEEKIKYFYNLDDAQAEASGDDPHAMIYEVGRAFEKVINWKEVTLDNSKETSDV